MRTIQKLYRIEADIKHLLPEQKLSYRQKQSMPILNAMKASPLSGQVTPTSLTGEALAYLSKQWPTLTVYCEDGRLDIDNNAVERAIRPFVVGRRNWLFAGNRPAKPSTKLTPMLAL